MLGLITERDGRMLSADVRREIVESYLIGGVKMSQLSKRYEILYVVDRLDIIILKNSPGIGRFRYVGACTFGESLQHNSAYKPVIVTFV